MIHAILTYKRSNIICIVLGVSKAHTKLNRYDFRENMGGPEKGR